MAAHFFAKALLNQITFYIFFSSFFKLLIFEEFSSALKFAKYIQVVFKEFKE